MPATFVNLQWCRDVKMTKFYAVFNCYGQQTGFVILWTNWCTSAVVIILIFLTDRQQTVLYIDTMLCRDTDLRLV